MVETKQRRLPITIGLASLACCGAVTVSNPFELIKTRLQLQGYPLESLKDSVKEHLSTPPSIHHFINDAFF